MLKRNQCSTTRWCDISLKFIRFPSAAIIFLRWFFHLLVQSSKGKIKRKFGFNKNEPSFYVTTGSITLIIYWATNNNHLFGEQFYWTSEASPITLSEPKTVIIGHPIRSFICIVVWCYFWGILVICWNADMSTLLYFASHK